MIKKKISNYLSPTTLSVAVLAAAMSYNAHAQQGYGCQGYSNGGYNERGYYGKGYSRPGYYDERRHGGDRPGMGMASDSRYNNRNYGAQGYGYERPTHGANYQRPAPTAYRYSASPRAVHQSSAANYEKAAASYGETVEQAAAATDIDVLITGMQFTAATHKVKVGEEVVWRNADAMPHTVTSSDGGPLNSGQLGKGGEYSFTFKEPGTYSYYCSYHPSMKGTIIVE